MKEYIPAITGLRTFAVMPVIAHHLGITLVSGGFLGVDVFFVISGFLISGIILSELENKTFNFMQFYSRRMLRLIPPLVVVLIATNLAGIYFLTPEMIIDNAKASITSLLYISNIYFWNILDYFSPTVDYVPLIHLWTLSVEEQFYFLFPLLLIIFIKIPYRFRLKFLGGICALGVICAMYLASFFPSASFYLLPTRMWEFLFGFYAALAARSFSRTHEVYSWISLLVLCLCFVLGSSESQNPGFQNLIIVIATSFLLFNFSNSSKIEVFLSAHVVHYLGLLSYSLYLWHQPVFVFMRLQNFVSLNPVQFVLSGLIIIFTLSALTFTFIEKPINKNKSKLMKARRPFTLIVVTCSLIVVCSAVVIYKAGLPGRYAKSELALLSFENYDRARHYREGKCFLTPSQRSNHFALDLCMGDGEVLFWGDSYSAALYSGSHKLFSKQPSQLTSSSCPPLIDGSYLQNRCKDINNKILQIISEKNFKHVILYGNWLEHDEYAIPGLEKTVFALKDLGVQSVIIVGPTPKFYPTLPYRLISSKNNGVDVEPSLGSFSVQMDAQLAAFSLRHNLKYFPPLEFLCKSGNCSRAKLLVSNKPIIWDDGHLTVEGARLLLKEMRKKGII